MTRTLRAPRPTAQARMLLARHRPLLAALAAAVAVLAALPTLAPRASTVPVLTAAHDLRWGAALDGDDLVLAQVPTDAVPDGALRSIDDARGRLLTSPVRRGEPITDLRLVGPALLGDAGVSGAGLVAVGVRIADAGVAELLRAGSVIDVLAARVDEFGAGFDRSVVSSTAEVIASQVRVLAAPGGRRTSSGGTLDGALVLVAATEAQAARLAAAAANSRLSVAIRQQNVTSTPR